MDEEGSVRNLKHQHICPHPCEPPLPPPPPPPRCSGASANVQARAGPGTDVGVPGTGLCRRRALKSGLRLAEYPPQATRRASRLQGCSRVAALERPAPRLRFRKRPSDITGPRRGPTLCPRTLPAGREPLRRALQPQSGGPDTLLPSRRGEARLERESVQEETPEPEAGF